jgi:hypothetical protein
LVLTINGTTYAVKPIAADPSVAIRAFRLRKADGTVYDVAQAVHGLTCDCPDFIFNRDGIDPDGCKDVHISNCTIETGDDALVFYSGHSYGPPRPCENITVTNCRLSSSSSALKFCDGNENAIRNVTIENCVITGSNRGIAFMVFDGGVLENVIISNVTVECQPFDWFWWGDGDPIHFNCIQRGEIDPNVAKLPQPPVGVIRNVLLRNVFARGAGRNLIHGHPESPLEDITLENVRLVIADDAGAPLHKAGHALAIENARHFTLKDVEVVWETTLADQWGSAVSAENARDLTLDGLAVRPAQTGTGAPAIALKNVDGALIKNSRAAPGTGAFVRVAGQGSRDITLWANDTRAARAAFQCEDGASPGIVREQP